jgi:stage V sporulation protein G
MVDISEVRVKLIGDSKDRLKAYCSITIGGNFVIRDLKIIDGANGLFVAMPSRKLAARCPQCHAKNHLRARFCNDCGKKFGDGWAGARGRTRNKLHADIAHPINAECRAFLQSRVIAEYEAELKRAAEPGYQGSGYDELDSEFDNGTSPYEELMQELKSDRSSTRYDEATGAASGPAVEPAESEPPPKRTDADDDDAPAREADNEFGAGLL